MYLKLWNSLEIFKGSSWVVTNCSNWSKILNIRTELVCVTVVCIMFWIYVDCMLLAVINTAPTVCIGITVVVVVVVVVIAHQLFLSVVVSCSGLGICNCSQVVSKVLDCRAFAGRWKSLSRFSRPGKSLKTDMVVESPWICVWRSLKLLELDFLKRRDGTSDCYHQMGFLGSNSTEMR